MDDWLAEGVPVVRLKSEEEQQQNIAEAEAEKASAFVISQEDIDAILLQCGIMSGGRLRIYEQFLKRESAAENAKFLKNEYGVGGAFPAIKSRNLDEWHDSKGIKISRGSISNPDVEVTLTWAKVAKRIGELIDADRYLSPAEKQKYFGSTPKNYNLSLGDTVNIGTQEYTILALSNKIMRLADAAYPLFETEMPRDEFYRKLAENPLNGKLLQTVETEPAQTDTGLEKEKQLINKYCMETFEQEADFSDLHSVALAMSSSMDGERTTLVSVDLIDFRFIFDVNGEIVTTLQCHDMEDLCQHLEGLDFDQMIAYAETEYTKQTSNVKQSGTAPYILCEWSESSVFKDETVYSIYEFDRLIKRADDEHVAGEAAAIEKYGTEQKWFDADDPEFDRFIGYDKVRFTIVLPDGRTFTKRQDIGDGDGGVLDFLSRYDDYREIIPILQAEIEREKERLGIIESEQTADRHDYRITDDAIGVGTPGTRFNNNIRAIRLLKKLEAENRLATPDEQAVLAQYVGWGGLAICFDENHSKYAELKSLLTEDEYTAARESTLTAFYTACCYPRHVSNFAKPWLQDRKYS